ncbi:MAG: hypothetical protein KME22_02465 [Hassallia sp. WJT32-NPBG1]|nr:hypothetical protein [Hassallia sp. WJT32-NPBG1]
MLHPTYYAIALSISLSKSTMRSRLQFSHLKLCDRASNLAIIVPLKLIMRSH